MGIGRLAVGVTLGGIALPYLAGALLFAIRDNAVTSGHVRWTLAGLLGIVLVVVTALEPTVGAAVVAIIGLAVAVLPLFGIDFVRRL